MNNFNIEKYCIVKNDNIDVSYIPMLLRRKLSKLDKIVFAILDNIYDQNIDNIILASEHGEFDRLKEIISQYQNDNMVSPTKFSSSVHNYSVSAFSQLNKITNSYTAISAGKDSLLMGVITSITQPNTRNCLCYADDIGIGIIFSTIDSGYTFKSNQYNYNEDFMGFLTGKKNTCQTNFGEFKRL